MAQPVKIAYTLTQCSHPVPGGSAGAALSLWSALAAATDPDDLQLVAVGARGPSTVGFELPSPSARFPWPYPVLYELWNRTERAAVEGLVPDADIVHVTLAFGSPTRRARQVCTVHDLFPFSHPEVLTRRGVSVMRAGVSRVLERADLIAVPSEATADEMVGHGAPESMVRVVPWGAEPMAFADDELDGVRRRFELPEGFLLFVGTVEPRKNLDVLLAALGRAGPDVRLVLAGPVGWGDIAQRVASLSEADEGDPRLRVLGPVSRRDLLGLMTAARAVCMPSIREGFGLPALESMAQGTPVIHSACPALREVVGDTGLEVDAGDVDGWAEAMTVLTTDASLAEALGDRGRSRARRFTWRQSADRMLAVYRELV